MNQSTKNPITGFIAAFETILLFMMGILGNKISENLEISSNTLLLLTGVGLGILAIISYFMTVPAQTQPNTTSRIKKFLPKTMVGVFPFGVFLGVIFGSFIPLFDPNSSLVTTPGLANLFGYPYFLLGEGELAGILGGLIACVLFAVIVDGYLAGSLLIGYWIAFATATVIKQDLSAINVLITYVGQGIVLIVISFFLIKSEKWLKEFRKLITETRV